MLARPIAYLINHSPFGIKRHIKSHYKINITEQKKEVVGLERRGAGRKRTCLCLAATLECHWRMPPLEKLGFRISLHRFLQPHASPQSPLSKSLIVRQQTDGSEASALWLAFTLSITCCGNHWEPLT